MRTKLRKLGFKNRYRFEATVGRSGLYNNRYDPYNLSNETILLYDVHVIKDNEKEYVTDHIWMKLGQTFKKIDIQEDDVIRFDARVDTYSKYKYDFIYTTDYRLIRPSKAENISRPEAIKDIPTLQEQRQKVVETWHIQKQEREREPITEKQQEYIQNICLFLKVTPPTLDSMSKNDAYHWISNIHKEHKTLHKDMNQFRYEQKKEETRQKHLNIYNDHKSGLSRHELAMKYDLKSETIKTIIKKIEKQEPYNK